MKFFEAGNLRFEVTSELGDDFLLFDDWARQNLTEEEYSANREREHLSEENNALFTRWYNEQKITSFKVYRDGVLENG